MKVLQNFPNIFAIDFGTGSDDAAKIFWLPLSASGEKEDEFFEDQAHVVRFLEM